MVHYMRLNPEPFEKIASGRKTCELRLNDEKRKLLQVGDIIIFQHTEDIYRITNVTVSSIVVAASFDKLFKIITKEECGCSENCPYPDMSEYYSLEEQLSNGVVGIRFELNHVNNLANIHPNYDEFKLLKYAKNKCPVSVLTVQYDKFNHCNSSIYGKTGSGFGWIIDNCGDLTTCEYDEGFSEISYEALEIVMNIMRDIKSKRDLITVVNGIAIPNRCRLEIVREDSLEFCGMENQVKYVLSRSGVLQSAVAISASLETCFDEIYEKVYGVERVEMLALSAKEE